MVNGRHLTVLAADDELLCDVLRDKLGRMGTRVGCREGVCGSCNVLVDGTLVRSCLILAAQVEGSQIRTVEGLSDRGLLSPLQQAFIDHGAVQCGFCTSGILITMTALLEDNPRPTDAEIIETLAGNLCRCTGYQKIVTAVRAAVGKDT
jgi:carbon-monoxide dehydrogenase small subunit